MALGLIINVLNKSFRQTCLFLATRDVNKQIKTAGIIGDEILKGDVSDTNSTLISKTLHNLGINVKKISVVGDKIDEVCYEVKLFSESYHYVITTGGIGPTHDDITYEAVAKAFNEPLIVNPFLKDLCHELYHTTNPNHTCMKQTRIPKSSKLTHFANSRFPQISVHNVYIFPGVPELVQKWFQKHAHEIFNSHGTFYTKTVYINLNEGEIASVLNEIIVEFPTVEFGSYPKLFNKNYKVKVTIESRDESCTLKAYSKLLEKIGPETIVNPDCICEGE